MKHALQTAVYFLIFGLLVTIVVGQTKPTAPTTNPVASAPQIKTMTFLDSTQLWAKPDGLGLGIQNCPLVHYSVGTIRDLTGRTISNKPLLEPVLDNDVLAAALKFIPQGGWIVLDAEGAHSFDVHESLSHAANVAGFARWKAYVSAARQIRPDCKIAVVLSWHPADGANYNIQSNWAECDACTAIFKSDILPLIQALAIEVYYVDFPPNPAIADPVSYNFWGIGSQRVGFVDHLHALNNWARAVSGKAPVHILAIQNYFNPATDGTFLSGPVMRACLDLSAMYDPAAVMLYGDAPNADGRLAQDGYRVGTFDPKADWVAEVKRRAK